ncbi:hypothetical protein H0H87_011216 [Tephrocybe sp. NHM501043]|nr:hypothetical protein H0H87_011216 [Tephrocybe sp. NHM501043]
MYTGAYPMPVPPFRPSRSATPQKASRQAEGGDDPCQQNKYEPPDFSSTAPSSVLYHEPEPDFVNINLSASLVTAPSPLMLDSPGLERRIPFKNSKDVPHLTGVDDMTLDPFLAVKSPFTISSYPSCQEEEPEPFSLTLPCTSTPRRKGRKGYKRADLDTITNVASSSVHDSSAVRDSLPSPTQTEPVVDSPSVQRKRSSSLGHSIGFDGFNSRQPAWNTPTKPMPSIIVQGSTPRSSSHEPQIKPITPLRIVKHKPVREHASTTSEVSRAVITAVRDAFAETRLENEEDATSDPRDLLSRASVLTCDTVPIDSSKSDMCPVQDKDYLQEVDAETLATPPPPYAFSNLNSSSVSKMDTVKAFLDMKRFSVSLRGSTELQYLTATPGTTPVSSVESCLDELLASFEHLMVTMPEFKTSMANPQVSNLSTAANLEKGLGTNSSAGFRVSGVQWSDVLALDNY